jgi:transcriptional regulator with XRE-family HTH domain
MYANIVYMNTERATLGTEIRRLRMLGGTTLRKFAQGIGVSAPHLSDIEHDRRRPSKEVLQRIARGLQPVGATHDSLERLDARFESDLQEWASHTPEVRMMLRVVKESGRPVAEVLRELEHMLQSQGERE